MVGIHQPSQCALRHTLGVYLNTFPRTPLERIRFLFFNKPNPFNRLHVLTWKSTILQQKIMFPSPPLYTSAAQEGIPFHGYYNNDNVNAIANNNVNATSTTATTKSEAIIQAQPDEERGIRAPEISSQQQQRRKRLLLALKLILILCTIVLIVYAVGCGLTRLGRYGMRAKESWFRHDCTATGGRVEVKRHRIPGWGVGQIDCLYGEGEGEIGSYARANRTLEMERGQVIWWR